MNSRRSRQPVIIIFGESKNDTDCLRELVRHANPTFTGRISPRPRPTSLTKGAGRGAVRGWLDQITDVITIERRKGTSIAAVLVHRDADGPDPDMDVRRNLAADLTSIPALPVVPVQMMEAWWFHFPDAVEAVRPGVWRNVMPRAGRDVENITNPKVELMRLTRKTYEYSEADSPAIAEKIKELSPPRIGACASFDDFLATAGGIR